MLSKTRRNTSSELLGFTYPRLHEGKIWFVDFFALDPATGEMRRKKFMLNNIPKKSDRKRRAAEIIESVTRQLRQGWNPWVNNQESRGFTLLSDCLDRYLEYIDKRRRKRDTILHRETQSVSLSRLMIRVLSDNDNLHLIKRTEIKGIENQFTWRITRTCHILLSHLVCKPHEIGLLKLSLQMSFPRLLYLYIHNNL